MPHPKETRATNFQPCTTTERLLAIDKSETFANEGRTIIPKASETQTLTRDLSLL